jgi:diguanylate cyclase (GGDEF)-like protein
VTEAPIPADDAARVASLRRLGLLDTPPEERFDRITRLAQRVLDVPVAAVTLVDTDRQWAKSHQGAGGVDLPRRHSFCAHAVAQASVLVVPDALQDARFADNPLVTSEPGVRFYAGCPIAGPDGALIGALCVLDRRPRQLAEKELEILSDLAAMVERELATMRLAVDDDLTGLYNRRGFRLMADQALALSRRQETGALLVYADIDGLKPVNDRYGHAAGDRLIVGAGRALRRAFRESDVVARMGGDEFAALLVGFDGDASSVARKIMAAADSETVDPPGGSPLSMSVGTARYDWLRPEPLDALVRRADADMYARKRATRAARAVRAAFEGPPGERRALGRDPRGHTRLLAAAGGTRPS